MISRRGERRQHEDAVREGEPIALIHELAGQKAVARHDRRQAWKVRVGGVGGEDEDEHRRRLDQVIEDSRPEYGASELRHARFGPRRDHLIGVRQKRDAEEHRDREHRHRHERGGRVLGLGRAERRHAVRHRLDAGHRGAAVRERRQQQERRQRLRLAERARRGVSTGTRPPVK